MLFPRLRFRHGPPQISGECVLPRRPLRWLQWEDSLFRGLRRAVPKPQPRDQHRNAWISEETWRIVDERVTMRRKARARMGMWRLGRAIQASLKGDRRRRMEEAGSAVETLLMEVPPNASERGGG